MKEVIMMSLSTQPKRVKGGNMRVNSKKWMISLILGCFVVVLAGGLVQAQTTTGQENWVYMYDNPTYDRNDLFRDIKRSPYDGFIYACGTYYRASSYTRIAIHKINPTTGVAVWTVAWDPIGGTDYYGDAYELDFDATGNIYIAASIRSQTSGRDFYVVKFDTHGTYVAHHSTNGYSSYNDYARSIDVGPDGYVYVGGYLDDSDAEDNFTVRKYTQSLVYQAQYSVDINGHHARCYRVRQDASFNVWACGRARIGSGNTDFYVVRLNSSLVLQDYYKTTGTASSAEEYALDLCLPWSGTGVYAGGRIYNSGTNYDMIVVRLGATSNEIWKWVNANANADQVQRIVCAPSNRVFAAGFTRNNTRANDSYTVVSLAFGLDWMWTYDGTAATGQDRAMSIDIDAAGTYVYATGYSAETGSDVDFIVSKHSLADTTIWVYKYDGPVGQADHGRAIDVSNDGNLYAAGNIELDASYYEMGAISLPQNFPPTIPTLVSPADAAYQNDLTVSFTWNTSVDFETSVSGYYLATTTDPAFATYDSVWSTDTTQNVVLTDATTYWAVKSKDSNGNLSKFSDIWSFQFDLTDPVAPVLTSPINDAFEFDTTVTFNWQAVTFLREVPSPVTYVIEVDTSSGFASPIALDTTASLTTDLELPTEEYYYYWHVMAFDAAGNEGDWSNDGNFIVDLFAPSIDSAQYGGYYPGPFDVFAKVTDTWGIDVVVLHYKRMEDPAFFPDTMAEGSNDWYQGIIPALTEPTDTVKYYIYAKDNAGKETLDPPTGFRWWIPTAIEESEDTPSNFAFSVKGNLIKGKAIFNLSLPKSSSVTLEIYDASGRLVATPATGTKAAGNHTITWTPQINGIYFYTLTSSYGRKVGKILNIK